MRMCNIFRVQIIGVDETWSQRLIVSQELVKHLSKTSYNDFVRDTAIHFQKRYQVSKFSIKIYQGVNVQHKSFSEWVCNMQHSGLQQRGKSVKQSKPLTA